MTRRKAAFVPAIIATLVLIAGMAWAGPWEGHRDYSNGYGPGNRAFSEETADLRSELAGKRSAYRALMAENNPNPQRAAELQRDIVRLEDRLRANTRAYRDTHRYGRYDGRGRGGGWSHRGGGGPRGGGYCW